ncbi:WD40-repeat-containing domain protein [Dichotomocladium elegans]|nr:WD40-repeat-containing domain protein [Dichotomocladium elegans]
MNLTRTSSNSSHAPGFLYAGFNQDYGCFVIGLDTGFRVYNCDPLIEQARSESAEGGFGVVEMLYRTNYLALVGGGKNPRYPPNKVIIYDSLRGKPIIELEYKSEVKNVKLRRDRLTVVLATKVFVYLFGAAPKLLYTFETYENDQGLASVSSETTHGMLAVPGRQKGHVQIVDLDSLGYTTQRANETMPNANVSIVAAHSGHLSCLMLNQDGSKCATASDKGTLIRVFNTTTGTLLHELRRGVDRAEIYSLSFNHDSTRLCVSSDKGTIHIFNLDPKVVIDQNRMFPRGPTYGEVIQPPCPSPKDHGFTNSGNRGSSLSFMKDLLPKYFSSEWSFANAKIVNESRCIVAFGEEKNTIIAICADGSWYKFCFHPHKGGECTRESFERFLKSD